MKYFLLVVFCLLSCVHKGRLHNSVISISQGDSFSKVLNRLVNLNVVNHPLIFKGFAKLLKKDRFMKIGTFSIPVGASYIKILDILSSGMDIGQFVTIPEGFNIFQIAFLLEQKEILLAKDFLTEIYNSPYLEEFGIKKSNSYTVSEIRKLEDKNGYVFMIPEDPPLYSLEGYLFPDTYNFPKNISAQLVVQTFIKRFKSIVNEEIQQEIKTKNKTIHEIITLASVIEKEATNSTEMPIISGVFHNRLKTQMRLQASPTLIYALIIAGIYKGNIAKSYLKPPWPSPYNTDYVKRLPLGPIANPGKSAILAALRPINHEYYYFCRNPQGYHTFTKTLDEHNRVVYQWRKYRRNWNLENR